MHSFWLILAAHVGVDICVHISLQHNIALFLQPKETFMVKRTLILDIHKLCTVSLLIPLLYIYMNNNRYPYEQCIFCMT